MERENLHLSDSQVRELKDILLGDKERILNSSLHRDKYCLDTNELSDPLDEASINVQTAQDIRFKNRENFYLKKVNKALVRFEEGVYGLCDSCDIDINFERLKARPTAELCIACKEETEMEESHNFYLKKSKSLGKTLSEMGKR